MIDDTFPLALADRKADNEEMLLQLNGTGPYMSGPDAVRWIVLHCSATRADRDFPVEALLKAHRQRGFRTIGYHFYIRKDGTRTQHRGLLEVGAHCRPYNRCSIGICYEGGLDARGRAADTRTPAQRQTLYDLLCMLKRLFPNALIRGHRELPGTQPKECPCFSSREYEELDGAQS